YPTASQKTIRKKKSRLRMTCQVPEEKKSWTPLNVLAITGGFFRSDTQRETRARRSLPARAPRTRRRSACRQRSPSYALILGQIGQQVKGARDEDRLTEPARVREGRGGVTDRLDLGEVAGRPLGEVAGRERAVAARGRGDEVAPECREGRHHPLHVLVGQD